MKASCCSLFELDLGDVSINTHISGYYRGLPKHWRRGRRERDLFKNHHLLGLGLSHATRGRRAAVADLDLGGGSQDGCKVLDPGFVLASVTVV